MNTIVYVGRLIASAKHFIAVALLFFLAASDLAAQGGGVNPADVVVLPLGGTPKTMFQSFNNVELTNGVSKLLDVVGNPADAYCAQPRTIRHAQVDLRLKMGPTSYEFGRQAYSASVQLFVSEYDASNSLIVPTKTVTLAIGFSPGNPNEPEQLYSFDITSEYPSLDHIAVSAMYLAMPGNPSFPAPATADLQNNIRLEASYSEVFAVPPFRPSGTSTDPIVDLVSLSDNVTQNPVTFQWLVGASGEGCSDDFPNYQFQLLRLYNRDMSKTSDETDIVDTVHWDRAMTIETGSSATQVKLTIPEGTGYYVWRVRPIGSEYPGGIADDRNWGVWSAAPAEGEVLALTNIDKRDIGDAAEKKSVFFYQEFDDGLNWIYSRTFTEGSEGTRIGEKISYANGLADVKQNQTHLQTDGRFLICQTVYDYVGRPSLKSLEAPVTSSSGGFGYYNGFLKHKTGGSTSELYTAKNFDAGTSSGTFQNPDPIDAGPLDSYYSDADADLQIPNAGGYAFTRALYSQDGTSRIKEQSGLGATLRVQKASGVTDRTTKTLYSGVSDFELIGMFGDEAPDAASVHKVITIDPNKVTSVQYVSKEGQTIATCLAKDANELLADLNQEHELGGTVTQTVKGDPTMGDHDKSTRLATTKPTDVTLTYHITPDVIQSACGSYCSTCDYKVIFSAYNVEDPTDFHKDSIFLPAAACSPLTPRDTSIVWHLDGPATYVIERRVLADNTAPESVTPENPDGKSFYEIHRNAIYQIARDQITAELDSVYKLIDSTSLDRLYAYLDTARGGIYRTSDTGYTIRTSCCTIGIPKEQCEDVGCSSPLPSFEQMLYERWGPDGTKWPNGQGYPKDATTNVDFGSNLDKYFFTQGGTPIYPHSGSFPSGTGAFDAMIQHMVDDGYDCRKLMTAWIAVVESFGVVATRKGDGNPEDLNGDFNLLSLFLRAVGTKYVGTSDCPYGDCGSGHGLGYLEYAYKYFRYDTSNYSADCEAQCGYGSHAGWGQDTLDAYYPEKQEWRVFYECVNSLGHTLESLGTSAGNFPGACSPADTNCLKALAASVEDTCRSACQAKFWGFVESIKDAYHHVGKTVQGDEYKVDTRTGEDRDPSGYLPANGIYDISLRQIYCEAQALVNHCSDSCSLTIFRSGSGSSRKIDSIGSPAERSRRLRALTYSYRIGLYNSTSGTCEDTTGHQDTSLVHISGTTSGSSLAKVVVDYLNYRLAEMVRAGDIDTYGYSLCASLRSIFQGFFGSLGCSWNSCGETGTKKSGDGLQSAKENGSTLLTSPCPSAYVPQIFLPGPDISGAFFLDDSCNLKFRRICTASGSPDTAIVTLCSHLCDDSCTTDICFKWAEPTIPDTTWEFRQIPCEQEIRSRLRNLISQQAERCVDSQVVYIAQQYMQHCADPKHVSDIFTVSYSLAYYHFTLFYFNRAGKLIRTVPPDGVDLSKRDRMSHPNHTYVTLYDYDSYGEVTQQSSPDGGITQFFYDDKGELRFSQSSEQMNPLPLLPRFSYTKYDALGRTIETGEGYRPMAVALEAKVNDRNFPAFGQHNRVLTFYSVVPYVGYMGDVNDPPRFTQNRAAYTVTDDGVATYYSYDPHGNVEWLIQQIPGLGNNYIRYEYDLASNNLLKIFYNEGKADQFYHRYSYDPDNRMSMVETSRDGKIWDRDAQYTYYMHGPLRRILTGEDSLQGTDYTYTVEGWLKGINHPKIDAVGANDPGRDATGTSRVGADAMGMVLGYYDGDYLRKKGAAQSQFNSATTGGYTAQTFNLSGGNLYNGNITSWSTQLMWTSILPSAYPWPFPPNGPGQFEQLNGTTFKYDRLNRLLSDTFMVNTNGGMGWTWNAMDDYSMALSYDPNGNIQTLRRNGWRANPVVMPPPPDVGLKMDRQTFHYTTGGGTPTNDMLQYVAEDPTISSAAYSNDIDNQNAAGNYHYDAVGRLIGDDQAGELIKWDPYGKVRTVKTPTQTITFFYDAAGNRVKKFAADDGASTATATYYVRSGDEKVLAIYSQSLHDIDGPTRESCNATLAPDADGDKRPDAPVCDNCPGTAFNPFQEDYDGDGIGDACDLCPFTPNATPPTVPCPPPVNEGDVPPPQPPAPGTQPQWSVIETRLAELLIYGNGVHERFATMKPWTDRDSTMNPDEVYFTREIGKKFYELKDHLGDVRVVFSDIKIALAPSWNGGVTVAPGNRPFMVDMVAYDNYYPFGMEQPARCYNDGSYRYGFNGKEADNELKGPGNSEDFGERIYDPRLGRWSSIDPITKPAESPYAGFANDPIWFTDPTGMDSSKSWLSSFWDGFTAPVKGAIHAAAHPIQTAQAFGHAMAHPVETAKNIKKGIVNGYNALTGDDPNARAKVLGGLAFNGLLIAGTAGTGAVAEGGEAGTLLTESAEATTVTEGAEVAVATTETAETAAATTTETATTGIEVGVSFGKLGTVVENPGVKITGFSDHGLNQVINRAVTPDKIVETMVRPSVVLEQQGGKYLYISEKAALAVTKEGKVVTAYSRAQFDAKIMNVLHQAGGK